MEEEAYDIIIRNRTKKRKVDSCDRISSSDNNSSPAKEDGTRDRIDTSSDPPVYVDVSSGKAYYVSIRVTPPYSNYYSTKSISSLTSPSSLSLSCNDNNDSEILSELEEKNDHTWTVRVGDVVLVHSDTSSETQNCPYPFRVPWNVAEVVSIWKKCDREKAMALRHQYLSSSENNQGEDANIGHDQLIEKKEKKEKNDDNNNDDDGNNDEEEDNEKLAAGASQDVVAEKKKLFLQNGEEGFVMLEVRWFYWRSEVPVSLPSPTQSLPSQGDDEGEELHAGTDKNTREIFETDHVDTCEATSLLGPAKLSYDLRDSEKRKIDENASISVRNQENGNRGHGFGILRPIELYCRGLFWSGRRKALVPGGPPAKRAARGRLYSWDMSRNVALRGAVERALATRTSKTWKKAPPHNFGDKNGGGVCEGRDRVVANKDEMEEREGRILLENAAATFNLSSAAMDVRRGGPLLGREAEYDRISNFLRLSIRCKGKGRQRITSSSILLAGPPGTGKTATVKSIVAELQAEQAKGMLPRFVFASINGMELRHPLDAYVSLWESISGRRVTQGCAAANLEFFFGGGGDRDSNIEDTVMEKELQLEQHGRRGSAPVTVLLLDEIDFLVTKKQSVLYNLLDWPTREGGNGLVVVGISNTINLTGQLHVRVQSRLGVQRCIFRSYGIDDICRILKRRLVLRSCDTAFEDDAIQFAARKTAVYSGDIRKAFQICRTAVEYVLSELESGRGDKRRQDKGAVVTISDIQKVTRSMLDSPLLTVVATSTSFEALILVTLASLRSQSGRENGTSTVDELICKMKAIAEGLGDENYLPVPTFHDVLGLLNRMGEMKLVNLWTPRMITPWPLIQLNIDQHDLQMALKNSTAHQSLIDKNLRRRF